jgi:hypothetical protein
VTSNARLRRALLFFATKGSSGALFILFALFGQPPVDSTESTTAMTQDTFSLRPVFIGWIALVQQLPLQLFFTLWCGGFFGGFAMASGLFAKGSWGPFVFFAALAFVGFPLVTYVGKKLNYARTEYRFFADRLEFDEGSSPSTTRSSS